jgi:uncharacterized protein YkwD
MATLLRGLLALGAGLVASLSTSLTLAHVHVAPRPAVATRAPVTEPGVIDGSDASSYLPKPKPTPAPTPDPTEAPAAQDSGAGSAAPAAAQPAYVPPAPRPVAPPPVVIGSTQQALINSDRAAAGLPPLSWSGCLAGIAAAQARAMASAGKIFHGSGVTQDFGCGLGSAQTGENVGYWSGGINDPQLNTMFMNSAEHRANILGPYHYVGTAWAVAPNGYAYIAVEFA